MILSINELNGAIFPALQGACTLRQREKYGSKQGENPVDVPSKLILICTEIIFKR